MIKERKVIFDFFMWFRENGEKYMRLSIEKMIDIYLEEKRNESKTIKET